MSFQNARFVTSAAAMVGYPPTALPEVVLAGRSNVGKSSFINALCQQKHLAYVGKRPGKTRLINFYEVPQTLSLVDAPGYGYAKRSRTELAAYGKLMEDYFSTRPIAGVLLIIDCRHGLMPDDEDMLTFIHDRRLKVLVVATKSDKLTQSERMKTLSQLQQRFNNDVILFSAHRPQEVKKMQDRLLEFIAPSSTNPA